MSPMTITPDEKAQCVSWFMETQSDVQVQENFKKKYKREPPTPMTVRAWHKQFIKTEKIQKAKPSQNPKTNKEVSNPIIPNHTTERNERKVINKAAKIQRKKFHPINTDDNKQIFKKSKPTHTTEEKAQVVNWYMETKSNVKVQRNYRKIYKKKAPTRTTIARWYKKFIENGNFEDRKRSGRPRTNDANAERIHELFLHNPNISIRSAAKLLDLPNSTVHRVLHNRVLGPSAGISDNSTSNLISEE